MNLVRPDEYEYNMLPMTDELFWNRVGWLRKACLTSDNFEFRIMWYNKLQELLKYAP